MTHESITANRLEGDATVEGDRARLNLRGTLATRTVERADAFLVRLHQHEVSELEIDLSGLTRLDSSGLAFLLRVKHRAAADGWEVSMVPPPPHLRNQIERLGLGNRLPFVRS